MKIKDVIRMANLMEKGNVLDPELAMFFLSELDGMIQSDMMLHAPEEIVSYTDQEQELLLKKPHDGIYVTYLVAMIRQCQGEFEGYENAQKSVDEKLKTFRRWYVQHYRPADTASRSSSGGTSADAFGFAYLTAYGLAVKHGYSGTEEEWLASLEGQPGAPGAAARMRFDAERGVIQWGVGEQWYDLFTLEELKDPVVEAMMAEVRALAEAAAREKDAANQAANTAAGHAAAAGGHAQTAANAAAAAGGHAQTAATAAEGALGSASRAYTSEQAAATAAGDAQVQAETAEGYAARAEAAANRAEDAAANGSQGGGNESGQNVKLDSSLTQSGKAADAKATGDEIKRVEGKIPNIEGLAKTEDIPKVPNWAMQTSKPGYTASEVGADPKGTAAGAVSAHNVTGDAHNDIRQEIKAIREQLAAFLDVDEETLNELSELIAAIAANQTSIAQLTSNKVSVTDIIDNLTTNVANKPLSAAQGVVLKTLIDAITIPTKLSQLTNDKGYITGYTETDPTVPEWAKNATKPSYSKSEVGLGNVDNVRQYSASNPPPYPVTKVNGQTGDVTVDVPTKVSQLDNDSKFISAVTSSMVTAALGYTPINPGKATLARHTDGLLYLFVNGKPVGSGVELPTGGIDGYITEDKQIIFNNLPDGEYSLAYLKEDGTISAPIGSMVKDTNVYYTITNTLTNCTNSNSATKVVQGSAYSATITAKSGYALSSVKVTMGGTDISSTAVSGGKIIISNVTGNIVITAVAEEIKADEPVTEAITITGKTSIVTDTGATRENTAGYCSTTHIDVSDIPKPCVIELTNAGWSYTDATASGYTRFYIADTTGAKIASGYTHPSKMPDGVTMECGTETTNEGSLYTTVTVTVNSDNIGTLRFAGYYSTITPDGFDATVTKATLTYTPAS